MRVLLVWPEYPATFWSFKHVLRLVSKKAAFPPLGLLTVAAMLPERWSLRLVDMNVRSLREEDLSWADCVFISGMIVQSSSAQEVIARCRQRGLRVVAGGPLFTAFHERFGDVDHLVLGEAEELMDELVGDLEAGRARRVYQSPTRPELDRLPPPRWDLIRLRDYYTMAVQFSRGCPFDCEFCDIVVMNGRRPRTKPPAKLIAELDALIERGWREHVFIVDDNFIGHKPAAKELMRELIAWRERRGVRFGFLTEASVNLAEDPELLDLMVRAGFRKVFLGLETPEAASLNECNKVQNVRTDLQGVVRTIQNAGIEVMGGFIVGFDNDPPDIFERQWRFIQESGVVTAMVGLLNAVPQTKLYKRLQAEGRLLADSVGNNTAAMLNYVPRLDRDMLVQGYRHLMRSLYEPRAYYRRIRTFLREFRPNQTPSRLSWCDTKAFFRSLWVMGVRHRGRRQFWKFMAGTLLRHPRAFPHAMTMAIVGHHFRVVAESL